MKTKMTLAAVLLGALVSSSAFANTGTINFIGSVSDTTCWRIFQIMSRY